MVRMVYDLPVEYTIQTASVEVYHNKINQLFSEVSRFLIYRSLASIRAAGTN